MNRGIPLEMQYGPPGLATCSLLGAVCYGSPDPDIPSSGYPVIPLDRLEQEHGCWIRWVTDRPVESGTHGAVSFREDGRTLFGQVCMAEPSGEKADSHPLRLFGHAVYTQIFETLRQRDFPYLVRCWNYLPDINAASGGLERYRQFNIGRQEAFLSSPHAWQDSAPAASALGSGRGVPSIYFLASRIRPLSLDNPRQVEPWRYPQQYGPRSPVFSRGALLPLPGRNILFISGTASILGHETVHADNLVAQTEETLRNIQAVMEQANHKVHETPFSPARLALKVFVRHAENWTAIRDVIARQWGELAHPPLFLRADVCRSDLLVEIEAYSHHCRE